LPIFSQHRQTNCFAPGWRPGWRIIRPRSHTRISSTSHIAISAQQPSTRKPGVRRPTPQASMTRMSACTGSLSSLICIGKTPRQPTVQPRRNDIP